MQRGPLARHSLTLDVVRLPTQAERLAWLAQAIPAIDGCGIVYTLTIDDARQVAEWLRQQGIDALSYTGADEDGERVAAEARLIANDVKVVVATSALGMGYDKPDLAFVIHYQAPGSAVHYYQQVGRAGRALETAHGILLDGDEDQSIISWFIDTAFPDQDQAEAVVALLETRNDWVSGREIETEINIRRSRLHNMMVNLEVDGAIERDRTKYRRTEQPWTFPRERVDAITALRRAEQQRMLDYRRGDGCLMQHLRKELDDLEAPTCGKCSHCTGAHVFAVTIDRELARSARDYLRQRPYFIDPRRQWSDGKRIGAEFRCEQGRALGRQGDGVWGEGAGREAALNTSHANDAGPEQLSLHERVEPLAIALAELVKVWQPMPAPTWLTYIPSTSNPHFAVVVAERIAALLGIALHHAIERGIDRPPQSAMENSVQQHRNVAGAFDVIGDIPPGPVILFDDSINSKWTMTVVGARLREAGSGPVFPLVVGVAGTDA